MARGQKALTELGKQLEARKRHAEKLKAVAKPERAVVVPIDEFMAKHGDYHRDGVKLINRHVTTVARWKTDSLLNETQLRAIELCEDLWEHAGSPQGLVMDLMKIPGLPGGSGMRQQDALDELASFKAKVPQTYWNVFENVVRWNEPGGAAGSRFANDNPRAAQSALMCVRFVADLIGMWRRL
jgi:hypothetical protein